MRGGNEGKRILKKYAVDIHGIGNGHVWASHRRYVRPMVVSYLNGTGEPVGFMQPMQITRLSGERLIGRAGVTQWQPWHEDEPQDVTAFNLVSMGG
jgi:hypothetical protein